MQAPERVWKHCINCWFAGFSWSSRKFSVVWLQHRWYHTQLVKRHILCYLLQVSHTDPNRQLPTLRYCTLKGAAYLSFCAHARAFLGLIDFILTPGRLQVASASSRYWTRSVRFHRRHGRGDTEDYQKTGCSLSHLASRLKRRVRPENKWGECESEKGVGQDNPNKCNFGLWGSV